MSGFKFFGNKSKERKLQNRGRPMNFRPFCDCRDCICDDCPDILQRLAITFSDGTCYFGTKKVEKSSSIDSNGFFENSLIDLSLERSSSIKSKSRNRVQIVSPKSSQVACVSQRSLKPSIKKKGSSETTFFLTK